MNFHDVSIVWATRRINNGDGWPPHPGSDLHGFELPRIQDVSFVFREWEPGARYSEITADPDVEAGLYAEVTFEDGVHTTIELEQNFQEILEELIAVTNL